MADFRGLPNLCVCVKRKSRCLTEGAERERERERESDVLSHWREQRMSAAAAGENQCRSCS